MATLWLGVALSTPSVLASDCVNDVLQFLVCWFGVSEGQRRPRLMTESKPQQNERAKK